MECCSVSRACCSSDSNACVMSPAAGDSFGCIVVLLPVSDSLHNTSRTASLAFLAALLDCCTVSLGVEELSECGRARNNLRFCSNHKTVPVKRDPRRLVLHAGNYRSSRHLSRRAYPWLNQLSYAWLQILIQKFSRLVWEFVWSMAIWGWHASQRGLR